MCQGIRQLVKNKDKKNKPQNMQYIKKDLYTELHIDYSYTTTAQISGYNTAILYIFLLFSVHNEHWTTVLWLQNKRQGK